MPTIVKMPQLGESVVEGTVSRWLKQPGERIAKHEPLLEIATDKIDTEVPAPADGVLLQVHVAAGTTVRAGTPLAVIGDADEQAEPAQAGAVQSLAGTTPAANNPAEGHRAEGNGLVNGGGKHAVTGDKPAATSIPTPDSAQAGGQPGEVSGAQRGGRSFISPVVARLAAEEHVDLAQVQGTGLNGRITKQDVLAFLAQRHRRPEPLPAVTASPGDRSAGGSWGEADLAREEALEERGPAAPVLQPSEVLTPLTAMRRAIAQHMVMSKRTSPHVTSIFEADLTAVVRHREVNKRAFAAKGIALTYTPYFVASIVAGLRAVPEANSRFTDAGIVINKRMHIGMAVALGANGLLVPVLRDADELNLQGLARGVNDLVTRARDGKLALDEVQGGTFTLTNHGTGGSLLATPIINQPQTGILGVGAIVKRPVVRSSSPTLLPNADDAIVIRPMCYLSFTFDHRVLDGAQGDAFLTAVKQRLENWQ